MSTTTAAPPGTTADQIEAVRAFNRFYTARIGALRDGLLATAHPLPEARVLFELGRRGSIDAADLRRVLDLDGGYLSRLLARLEDKGLVARERSPDDGRRQRLELTDAGRVAYETLDERSAAEIGALLDGLGDPGRDRLLDAMATMREILESAPGAAPGAPPRISRIVAIASRRRPRSPSPSSSRRVSISAAERSSSVAYAAWPASVSSSRWRRPSSGERSRATRPLSSSRASRRLR